MARPALASPCSGMLSSRLARISGALAYCRRPRHLRRTVTTALVVGAVLTVINQATILAEGDATAATYVRCVLNFCVPFVVSNIGLLSGRPRTPAPADQ